MVARIIGIATRRKNGSKAFIKGGKRGLIIPDGWRDASGPLFVVEGPSDVAAMLSMGLVAIGRPSASGGAQHLVQLLRDISIERKIIVLGELDPKPSGRWPGRDGAVSVATKLADGLGAEVQWAVPPDGAKDVRDWLARERRRCTDAES